MTKRKNLLNINLLMDCADTVYNKLKATQPLNKQIEELELFTKGRTNVKDFEIVRTLAKGGYGEVYIVRNIQDKRIYAMKRISKEMVFKQPHTALFMAEKEVMVDAQNSEWLVFIYHSFQDPNYLYLIMDFIPGGDFMGLLARKDILSEEEVRFYAAEIVLGLEELHVLGYIHRDLKPDNILITREGHIKLADFGSCIKKDGNRARSSFTVGTPDYVSVDILESMGVETEYGEEVDFWTLGVVIYEMIYGNTPFYSNTLQETYKKISSVDFEYPSLEVSVELKDLISKLICRKEARIGLQGIKDHRFFNGINWERIRQTVPPFVPVVCGEADTSNFEDGTFEPSICESLEDDEIKDGYLHFVGFSYDPNYLKNEECVLCGNDFESKAIAAKPEIEKSNTTQNTVNAIVESESEKSRLNFKDEEIQKEIKFSNSEISALEWSNIKHKENEKLINKFTETLKELSNVKSEKTEEKVVSENKTEIQIKITPENTILNVKKKIDNKNIIIELLRRSRINSSNIAGDIESLQNDINLLNQENIFLTKELSKYKKKLEEAANKSVIYNTATNQEIKKQLRMKKTEIREYQQKLNQEISLRQKLEDELKYVKQEKDKILKRREINSSDEIKRIFSVREVGNSNLKVLKIEDCKLNNLIIENNFLIYKDIKENLNNVYAEGLRNNELYLISPRKRALIIKIYVLKEEKSASSVRSICNHSLKQLEEEIEKEEKMKSAIERLLKMAHGDVLENGKKQLNGSIKRLEQLKGELQRMRKSSCAGVGQKEGSCIVSGNCGVQSPTSTHKPSIKLPTPSDSEKGYEFNNHFFNPKTFPPQTLCYHCNEILYGSVNQGLECKECKMITHKSCYTLMDVSCELYKAIKSGRVYYVLLRCIEDKDRLMRIIKG